VSDEEHQIISTDTSATTADGEIIALTELGSC